MRVGELTQRCSFLHMQPCSNLETQCWVHRAGECPHAMYMIITGMFTFTLAMSVQTFGFPFQARSLSPLDVEYVAEVAF